MADIADQKSYYEYQGRQYPRVTHVLKILEKPGLGRWRGRIGNTEADAIAREGSRIGREFHEVVQEIHQGRHERKGWQAPGEYRFMADAYIDWIHRNVEKIVSFETTYYSVPHVCIPECPPNCDGVEGEPLYAGTLDVLGYIRGDDLPSIIDVKTAKSYGEDWPLQLSGYRKLLRLNGTDTKRRIIAHVPKEGKVEVTTYEFKDHEGDELAWNNALGLWLWSQDHLKRKKESKLVVGFS